MAYDVEYTDEFGAWWAGLSEAEQVFVPIADNLYDQHLAELKKEGLL